ncbi:hypothetical protein AC579_1790 [Pseudocercospora musae]|uniref:AAA+ ATPase domain-containing protein n=1 Tax=Pseudocercospora musae TaxID=113226 RepID=A0A139I0P7_9PEZI|nr:hypothetical protein AC579_1790 [Pseudocercospora musae]KXT08312.1 hypothetical protein AC579_1790 [Pseudocercospora musae]
MAEEGAIANGNPELLSAKKIALEEHYIQLLEKRIAQLEAQIGLSGTAEDKKKPEEPRVKNVIQRWNDDKYGYEIVEASSTESAASTSKTLTTFRKVMDRDNDRKLKTEEIDIESPELKALFLECSLHRDKSRYQHGDAIKLTSPFYDFVWYYDNFMKECEPQPDDTDVRKEARQDLTELMAVIKKSSLEPYFKIRESLIANGTILYEWLWTLFPGGQKVYAKPMSPVFSDYQMLEVYTCDLPSSVTHETIAQDKKFTVGCTAFDFDGVKFEKYYYEFTIKKFDNERAIHKLELFPTKFYRSSDDDAPDDTDLQRDLLKRGKKFVEMCTADAKDMQCDYNGTAIAPVSGGFARLASGRLETETMSTYSDDREDKDSGTSSTFPEIQGQVIVDNYLFLRSERNEGRPQNARPPLGEYDPLVLDDNFVVSCGCAVCRNSPTIRWNDPMVTDLVSRGEYFSQEEIRLKMCPPKLLGYALRQKIWAQFRISDLERMDCSGSSERRAYFDSDLQLDQKYKDILMAFINHHESKSSRRNKGTVSRRADPQSFDIIEDKGKGLAILLHGAPGVGKTLTAETIALATGRPLLVVSVAEVGTAAAKAEGKLSAIFGDAARWGAIILMDEADVFLEAREKTENPDRNALVSVLLRCLEYYEGIIILTTNRIRSFDVAVQSRMHLAIQYDDLQPEAKANIYRTLLKKIPKYQLDDELQPGKALDKRLDQLCRRGKINGRQIRNAVGSAYALAKDQNHGILKFEHLEEVHEMTMDFVSSLWEDTRGTRSQNEAGKR